MNDDITTSVTDTFNSIVEGLADAIVAQKVDTATVTPVRKSAQAKEATVSIVVDSQSKTSSLSALIEESATASGAGDAARAALEGYETTFVSMLTKYAAALAAGNTETDIRTALQSDQKQSGTPHVGAAKDSCQTLTVLAGVVVLDGDLPEGYVFRTAAKNGAGVLQAGEESLGSLVRSVRAPADTAVLKDNGHGGLYGKAVVDKIIADSTTKAEAVEGLLKARAAIKAALAEANKTEQQPKDALKFLKAAAGPLGKVQAALDAGDIGDLDEVTNLVASLRLLLDNAAKHAALVVK